jgi:hypothetical protein
MINKEINARTRRYNFIHSEPKKDSATVCDKVSYVALSACFMSPIVKKFNFLDTVGKSPQQLMSPKYVVRGLIGYVQADDHDAANSQCFSDWVHRTPFWGRERNSGIST